MERMAMRSYLISRYDKFATAYGPVFEIIRKIGKKAERVDCYGVRIQEMFREGYGVLPGARPEMVYVFTGKIYEPVDRKLIESSLQEWFRMMKMDPGDFDPKSMYKYYGMILDTVRDRPLRPRLDVMAFENCVVDFSTLRRYTHSPEFDCIKLYPFRYDRTEILRCYLWKSFLAGNGLQNDIEGVLPERDKRRVLQMFLGAALIDRRDVAFEYFLILQGTGANGKSVIYRVLKDIFGEDEILNMKLSQLGRRDDSGLRAAYAMDGKRLMYCTEAGRLDFRDASILKALSSGEPVAARGIGANIKMMTRPPVMLCNSNYHWRQEDFLSPDVPDDLSLARRAVVINFDKTIPPDRRDTMLAERLKSERAGIFAWIVKGLVELRRNGYRLPDVKPAKTDNLLDRMRGGEKIRKGKTIPGCIAVWLELKGIKPEGHENMRLHIRTKDLWDNLNAFCLKTGVETPSNISLGHALSALGYIHSRKRKGNASSGFYYEIYTPMPQTIHEFMHRIPAIAETAASPIFAGIEYREDDFVTQETEIQEAEKRGWEYRPWEIEGDEEF